MFASYLRCVCSGLYDELITRPEKPVCVCVCVCVCLMLRDPETSTTQPWPQLGCCTTEKVYGGRGFRSRLQITGSSL